MQNASTPDGTVFIEGKVVTALARCVALVAGIIERYTGCVIVSGVRLQSFRGGQGVRERSISSWSACTFGGSRGIEV